MGIRSKTKKRKNVSSQFKKEKKRAFENKREKATWRELVYEMSTVLNHHFPNLHQQLNAVVDPRKAPQYQIDEIVGGAIAMFMFKTGSRNSMDNLANTGAFRKNFYKLFRLKLPKMDTVAKVFDKLHPMELEDLKIRLVKNLIEKRVFDKQRYKGKLIVAIDGTGLMSFPYKHCDNCCVQVHPPTPKRPYEKRVYFHRLLEAKLVTESGFSISICTEWIENDGEEYSKQDCEIKAFGRLADKLKTNFPRTQFLLCADGLYPKNYFFSKCTSNNWDYIVTLPDNSLKGLWRKIELLEPQHAKAHHIVNGVSYHQDYKFINNIAHNGYTHNWIETLEQQTSKNSKTKQHRFVHLSNIELTRENVNEISQKGRLRWRIEKEGFDQQKNEGYNLTHKYCRRSNAGMKNFYQVCQIGHFFNQLIELAKNFEKYKGNKITKKHLWFCLWIMMIEGRINAKLLARKKACTRQIEYVQEKVHLS